MGRAFEAVDPNVPCSRVRFFSCAMVTRGYVNLTERAVSIARTGERAQIDIRFPSSLQSKPFKRSSYFA